MIREEKRGRMLAVHVGPTVNDAKRVYADHLRQWNAIIDRIADLLKRVDTGQTDVAATVHFACRELRNLHNVPPTEKDVIDTVLQWKQKRRPPLNEKEVAMTVRHLNMLSRLDATASTDLPITEEEVLHV